MPMSDYLISIPDTLYEKARRVAEQTAQQVDDVIREKLADAFDEPLAELPADEVAELRALAYLSDDTLWTIAREQMPAIKQERMSMLMDKNSYGTISNDEYQELSALVESGQRLMLRKSEAMTLLLDRGFKVGFEDLKPVNE
jgi:hypothetical protein